MRLLEIISALKEAKVRFCLVGGYAVALHGVLRGTVDLDLLIVHKQEQFLRCEAAMKQLGLSPRLPVTAAEIFQFREEYIERRNLTAWSFVNLRNPVEIVDVILTHDLASVRVEQKRVHGQNVPVIALADLIKMKRAAGRPQDLEDAEMLMEVQRGQKK